jgi:hypothetical protein
MRGERKLQKTAAFIAERGAPKTPAATANSRRSIFVIDGKTAFIFS